MCLHSCQKTSKPKYDSLGHFQRFNVKNCCDPGDLENEVKVKFLTCNKRSYSYTSRVYLSSLYLKWLLIYGHLSIPLVIRGSLTLTHKIQKRGHSDLISGVPYCTHLRCPQVQKGALRSIGLSFCHIC